MFSAFPFAPASRIPERAMRAAPTLLTPIAALLCAAASAEAQYLHGRVMDMVTGEGIASATVLVLNPDRTVRGSVLTNEEGWFALRTSPGRFVLRVERAGYATTASRELPLTGSDTLDFAVRMPLRPTTLEAVTVTTRGPPLDPSGFFTRRDAIAGTFLGPYEVERRHPNTPADLLTDIPGFQIIPGMGGSRVLMTGRNRYCEPTVYVDGRLAYRGTQTSRLHERSDEDGVFLESLVNANAIRAVEAYQSGATAPAQFRPVGPIGGGDCGVLVFWTRLGLGLGW
ncbi:MAG TPA: carboxypeptidase-like regulatory domain-containing protein [Longimicrobiaceae bacterium]